MLTIWKFPLEITDSQIVSIPNGAEFFVAQMQNDDLYVWAKINPTSLLNDVTFYIHGTGHKILNPSAKYIDTFQSGTLVFHVFWDKL